MYVCNTIMHFAISFKQDEQILEECNTEGTCTILYNLVIRDFIILIIMLDMYQ